jgi:hypothetical protein
MWTPKSLKQDTSWIGFPLTVKIGMLWFLNLPKSISLVLLWLTFMWFWADHCSSSPQNSSIRLGVFFEAIISVKVVSSTNLWTVQGG